MFAMRTLVLATVLVGCGSPAHAPAPIAAQPLVPIAVVVAPDASVPFVDAVQSRDPADPDGPAAAIPIPGESAAPPIEMIDTTIGDAEAFAIRGWPAAKQAPGRGEVWVVLHVTENDRLELAIVRDDEGIARSYGLGTAKRFTTELTFDGDAFPARDHTGDYQGPIVFAGRVGVPGRDTLDQVLVFADRSTLRVARRPLGAAAWTPVLSLAFTKGTTFRGIGTTDPH